MGHVEMPRINRRRLVILRSIVNCQWGEGDNRALRKGTGNGWTFTAGSGKPRGLVGAKTNKWTKRLKTTLRTVCRMENVLPGRERERERERMGPDSPAYCSIPSHFGHSHDGSAALVLCKDLSYHTMNKAIRSNVCIQRTCTIPCPA